MLINDYYAQAAVPLADGSWVPSNVLVTAEVIKDFFPDLEVRWLSKDKRMPGDDAFQIVEKTRSGAEVVAFTVASEAEFDDRLLQKIFQADAAKQKNGALSILEKLDASNRAIKAANLRREMDRMEEAKDITTSVLKSPLNTYTHNGYRYDLPEHLQPRKVIFDVGVGHQTSSKTGIR